MAYQFRTSNHDDQIGHNRRLYNPYQDLQVPVQNLYKLPTSPEFLFQEESIAQRRSWGENLTYYTGIGYLAGAVSGAGKGFIEGINSSETGDTMKLRVNRILNASGHTGRKFGNRAGVIGLMYAGLESGMVAVRDADDIFNSLVAGLGTGALYKAAAGPRSAAVAGAIGGTVVGLAISTPPRHSGASYPRDRIWLRAVARFGEVAPRSRGRPGQCRIDGFVTFTGWSWSTGRPGACSSGATSRTP